MSVPKSLLDFLIVLGSLIVMVTSGVFAVVTIKANLDLAKIKLQISENQLDFAKKVQQNIDNNRVEIGLLKSEIRDIKGLLKREKNFKDRREFPPENIPPHTDF